MSDVPLVIGIDGGQTSVKAALATLDGRVLAEGRGAGLIHLAAAGGRERMVDALGEALASAWRAARLAPRPLAAIALGLTGVEADSPEAVTVRDLLPAVVDARHVDVQNDGVAALVGAHLDGPGVIVVSGTGMIVHGKDAAGRMARVGGWGWLLGDEGGAIAIGRDGLIAALHAFDGVAPATALQAAFLRHFAVDDPRAIKPQVFMPDFGAAGFAALAPIVGQAAAAGDAVAQGIIEGAGRDLAREVVGVTRRLDFGDAPLPVAPVGGGFEHLGGLRAAFTRALADVYPQAVVVDPALPPTLGAVLMAVRAAGGDVAAATHHLRARPPAR